MVRFFEFVISWAQLSCAMNPALPLCSCARSGPGVSCLINGHSETNNLARDTLHKERFQRMRPEFKNQANVVDLKTSNYAEKRKQCLTEMNPYEFAI